jgi:hypothetical protein
MTEYTSTPRAKKIPRTGVVPWIRDGTLPKGRGSWRLKKFVRDLEKRLFDSLGGLENCTPQQEILARTTIRALGVLLLAERFIEKHGPLRKDLFDKGILDLQPVLGKSYIAYMNTIRQNLLALGLERRELESEMSLADVIREHDEKKAEANQGEEEK